MTADVCFFLEGTYPYVSGGVSSWVHSLITNLSDLKFSLMYIGSSSALHREYKYEIPHNVIEFREVFLREGLKAPKSRRSRYKEADWQAIGEFLDAIKNNDLRPFDKLVRETLTPETIDFQDLFFSKAAWNFVEERYLNIPQSPSYLDYFWTWRFACLPIMRTLAAQVPRARCYHAVSTGYAGLMGAATRARTGAPLVLTEHGIYTKERRIEIDQADWIFQSEDQELEFEKKERFFKQWWIKSFLAMSRITYAQADMILTLFEGNRRLQIKDGADPEKLTIVPNGIDVERFRRFSVNRQLGDPPTVALIGRVVPIKDIKTFLNAIKIVNERRPEVRFLIMGPTDEDIEYFQECLSLAKLLSLDDVLTFTGKVNLMEYMGKIDCQVLTSVSEGQPLVILEGAAAGVPFVASDVGACSELAQGRSEEDKVLGVAGLITPMGNPNATAQAILKIIGDKELHAKMAEAGLKRAETYYRQSQVSAIYQQVYEELPLKTFIRQGLET